MALNEILKKYSFLFNLIGESCIVSSDADKYSCFHLYVPAIVSVLITTSVTVSAIIFEIHIDRELRELTIFNICFSSRLLTKITVCAQLLFFHDHFLAVFARFRQFESTTKSKFEMSFIDFQIKYASQVSVMFVLWFITLVVMVFVRPSTNLYLALLVILLLTRVTECHILFYVNLLKKCISEFLEYVRRSANNNTRNKTETEISVELYFVKRMHFKLWETAEAVNKAFGWSSVALFLQHFIDILQHQYWIFLGVEANSWDVLRNHISTLCPNISLYLV